MALDRWVLTAELRGGLLSDLAAQPAAVVAEGVVVDVTRTAARAGVEEGMAERTAVLRLPSLRRKTVDTVGRKRLARALQHGLGSLADEVRISGDRGAALTFLPLPSDALRQPWADACARLVPAHGWQLEGAASEAEWAAWLVLRAGRQGAKGIRCMEVEGGRLFVGEWRSLPPSVLSDVAPADRERIRRQGVHTLGQLANLPPLVSRALIGPVWAQRLSGDRGREESGGASQGRYRAQRRFEAPLSDRIALSGALALLAAEIADALRQAGEGARYLSLTLETEEGEARLFERECLFPIPPIRLGGAVDNLLASWGGGCAIGGMWLAVEGGAMGWSQARLTGGRLGRPVWSLPGEGGQRWAHGARLRREARLALWDPLRGGGRDVQTR